MRDANAEEIAVVTPYSDEVNRQLTDYLDASEVRVKRLSSFRAPDTAALGRITSAEVRDLARATMGEDCDGLFIACTQLPTYEILDALRKESGRPVWSSVHATALRPSPNRSTAWWCCEVTSSAVAPNALESTLPASTVTRCRTPPR